MACSLSKKRMIMATYGFVIAADDKASVTIKQIEESLSSLGLKAQSETKKVTGVFDEISNKATGIASGFKNIISGALGISAAFAGFEFLKSSKEKFDNFEKSVTNLKQTLLTMRGAAGISEMGMMDIAKNISGKTTFGKSGIIESEAMLATFGNIKGEQFKKAMDSAADYATKFMGGDMTEGAKSLGIALDDPIKGMSRLHRQGVSFSAEQKNQIKNLQEQGRLSEAQEIILKEIAKETGGQAEAFAKTDEGKIMMAKKQWGEIQLTLGEALSKLEVAFIPVLSTITGYIKDAFNSEPVQFFLEHLKDLANIAIKIIPIWLTYKGIMMAISVVKKIAAIDTFALKYAMLGLSETTEVAGNTLKSFGLSLTSIGVGAFAVALGLIVEKFISLNTEMEESMNKMTHLKETSQGFKSVQDQVGKTSLSFSNLNGLTDQQKIDLYNDMQRTKEEAQKQLNTVITPALQGSKKFLDKINSPESRGLANLEIDKRKAQSAVTEQTKQAEELNKTIGTLNDQMASIAGLKDSHGKSLINPKTKKSYDPTGENSGNTASLSGASGGLGQAKTINIHFHDALQKNIGVVPSEMRKKSQEGADVLVRALNNISESQGQTQ